MRTELVDPSRRREQAVVARVSLLVLVAMVVVAGLTRPADQERAYLLSYQVAFGDLPPLSQSLFREARVAIDEMCFLHQDLGRWPTVAELEEEGIPPFAPLAVVGRRLSYTWTREEGAGAVAFLGRPAAADLPAILVRLEESVRRLDPAHAALRRADAHHVRLPDGTVVHASLWLHADPAAPSSRRPELAGWRQVVPAVLAAPAGGAGG